MHHIYEYTHVVNLILKKKRKSEFTKTIQKLWSGYTSNNTKFTKFPQIKFAGLKKEIVICMKILGVTKLVCVCVCVYIVCVT